MLNSNFKQKDLYLQSNRWHIAILTTSKIIIMAQTAIKAREAFNRIRAAAERGDTPELTLDEINAEIKEVRRLRKEHN